MIPLQPTTPRISGLVILRRMFIALVAVALAAPVTAQNIRDAADSSSVLDNTAKGISNGGVLLTAIPGASPMALPIKTTGYFGGGGANDYIGTLGIGNERGMFSRCPFVNAHREEDTYTPGTNFNVRDCGLMVANYDDHGGECTEDNSEMRPQGDDGKPLPCSTATKELPGFWVGIRVYGMICTPSGSNCQSLENGITNPSQYENGGYIALLKPGADCGPAKWPTQALRSAGSPGYAEWCDFGVNVQ